MKEHEILTELMVKHDVPGHMTRGNSRRDRAANQRYEVAHTFSNAAACYLDLTSHPTFKEFKRRTIRRQFYGITPLMWVVWAFRLASWAKTIWDLWQSHNQEQGIDSHIR